MVIINHSTINLLSNLILNNMNNLIIMERIDSIRDNFEENYIWAPFGSRDTSIAVQSVVTDFYEQITVPFNTLESISAIQMINNIIND